MASTSYLEEYRKRFSSITSPTSLRPTDSSTDSVQALLSRYLGSDYNINIVTTEKATDPGKDEESYPDVFDEEDKEPSSRSESHNSSEHDSQEVKAAESETPRSGSDDELDKTLFLPSGTKDRRISLTVNQILQKDNNLAKICLKSKVAQRKPRRHSSPLPLALPTSRPPSTTNPNTPPCEGYPPRRVLSFHRPIPEALTDHGENNDLLKTVHIQSPDTDRPSIHRRESSKSMRSVGSNNSSKNDFSDDEFEFEFELNDSSKGDSDKALSRFELDNDSQKDCESIASYDDIDTCSLCSPTSARSLNSSDSGVILCTKCAKRQIERRETIQELLHTEKSYGLDLGVIENEFHQVLLRNGLLDQTTLETIFGHLSALISINRKFVSHLENHFAELTEAGEDAFCSAMIGQIMSELSIMFLAFENYCIGYANAAAIIDQQIKEKELFRLFLEVAQNENPSLRRMDLKTFLMLPVQRIMKYPLLLKRLLKATHSNHSDREHIVTAIEKLSNILHHINSQCKLISMLIAPGKDGQNKKKTSLEIALTKLSIDTVGWSHDEIHFMMSGKIGYITLTDPQWEQKLKSQRFTTGLAVLVTRGKIAVPKIIDRLSFMKESDRLISAALLIIKKGANRLVLLRPPFYMNQCIVSRTPEFHDIFEIQESVKETFLIRPTTHSDNWYQNISYFSQVLSGRRGKRRNATHNLMLHNQATQ